MNAQIKKQGTKKSKTRRKWLWLAALTVGLCLLLLLITPWILSSSGGTAFLLGRINRSLDGTLGMENLSLGWLDGVRIKNLTFEDTDGRTQVRVDSITSRPKLLKLLRGRLWLDQTVLERPDLRITLPRPEISQVEKKPAPKPPAEKPSDFRLDSMDLQVREGRAVIEQRRPAADPLRLEVKNLASTVRLNQPGSESSLELAMDLGNGQKQSSVRAKGTAETTAKQWGLKGLSGQFEMQIDSLSLETLRPLMALAGKDVDIAGTLKADAEVRIADGQIETLNASAVLDDFQQVLAGKVTRLDQPVRAEAKISSKGKDLLIDALSIQSSFCQLEGRGGLNALDYTLTADLAKTQQTAASLVDFAGYEIAGLLSGTGKIRRQDETFTAVGQNEIQNFALRQADKKIALSRLTQTMDLAVTPGARQLEITDLALSTDPAQLRLTEGRLDWSRARPDLQMNAAGTVHLKEARPLVDFFYPLPADITLEGLARPDLAVTLKDGKARLRTRSTAIDNLKITKTGAEPFVSKTVTLRADALLDLENKTLLELSDFELISDPVKLRGTLQNTQAAGQNKMSGQMDAEYDLKNISTLASPFLPEGLTLEGKRQDRFSFQTDYPADQPEKKMANLRASGQFGFDKAEYKGLHIGPARVELKAEQGILALDLADTVVNEGTLRFAGDIDLTAQPKTLRLRKPMKIIEQVNINDQLTQNLLEYVNPFFAGATRVSGIADFSCDQLVLPLGPAEKDPLAMQAVLAIRQMNMRPGGGLQKLMEAVGSSPSTTMTLHPTSLRIRDQVLQYEKMQLDIGDNPIDFAGRIGLDRKLNLTMQLPWTIGGGTIRSGQTAADRITVAVGGTIDKPEIDWGKILQQNVDQLIRQGLERLLR